MIKKYLIITLLLGFTVCQSQEVISLYNQEIPNSKKIAGLTDNTAVYPKEAIPELTVFLPKKSKSTGIAVIVCPGGSYSGLAIGHEGYDIARKLSENGIAGFVLKYRLPNPQYVENKQIVPLQDAQRAIQLIRENCKKWGINPHKIGIEGNSAGGHLASTAGTHFQKDYIENPLKTSLRPDFLILNYPVISMADDMTHIQSRYNLIGEISNNINESSNGIKSSEQRTFDPEKIKEYSNDLQVTAQTPPSFVTHAVDDDIVKVQNAILFIAALQKNKVPVESFFYAKGGHGYGMHNPTSDIQWIDICIPWILRINK